MSYVWRSILKGLNVLKEGIIWRIGDGSNVRIWEEPWFPRGATRQPSTHKGDCELELVSELIDFETLSWNRQRIEQHFHEDDVPIILSIPLRENTEDFIAWHLSIYYILKAQYRIC
jgi:hypothetical protein